MTQDAVGSRTALPTGAVTFLLTDVEGSTRLWEAGEEAAAAAIARHYELLDAAITLHGGARPVEQGEGDSVVAAFAKPSDALAAALDIQRVFAGEPWPGEVPLRVRVALHTGEAHLRDEGNYAGPAIIRCARLRALAHGGQTLLSDAARELVRDRVPDQSSLRDLGAHRLKDLSRAEHVWQLCHPDLMNEFPALRSLDALPNNLPPQLTTFVGREAELAEVRDALSAHRLVTLTGAGGCGKTRLALQVAADVVDGHSGGAWWTALAPVSDPDLVPYAVATTFGLHEEPGRPLTDTLAEQLRGLDALLVLDNCEHVLGECARVVAALLSGAPNLSVLATSREPLGLPAEAAWRVPSLDAGSATRLFVERAALARPGFTADADETEVVAQICHRLDGMPLAIELAAARTRLMHPARIAVALDDRFRLLTGGSRTAMPRQQTLEASVAWSYDLLDEQERSLLRRLSVFAGGFTLEAAETVGAADDIDEYAVLDLLSRLVDKSLVHADHEPSEARFRLLETIRQYALGRLVEAGESDATRSRHLEYFLELAEAAEPELAAGEGPGRLARLEREHDNLRAALEWADASRADEPFLRLVTALTLFWELRGHLASGGRWFARALAHDTAPSATRARALWGAAHVAVYGDDFATAARRAPEALEMAQAVGDEWATARALNTVGFLQLWIEPEPARAALAASVEHGRTIGDAWAVADGLKMISVSWLVQEDFDATCDALADLLAVARELDNQFFVAWYHCGVGWAAIQWGEFDRARHELETSLERCAAVGEPATGGLAVFLLGQLEAMTGDYEAASARLEALLARAGATGGGLAVPNVVITLVGIALGCGDAGAALEAIEPLVEAMRAVGLPWYLSEALSVQGAALLAAGDDTAARAALDEAKAHAASIDNHRLLAQADHYLGRAALREGDELRAEDLHHEALALRHGRGLRPAVAESLEALAGLAAGQESAAEATRLFAAADALRRAIGFARWPAEAPAYERGVARARGLLDPDTFEAAWAEGAALTVDDAVAYASRARGQRKRPSSGWASLTPTEARVVALVAEGLTNPQIAERLFVARGTVKVHLAHVFTKLGVATRAELAAEVTRRGAG